MSHVLEGPRRIRTERPTLGLRRANLFMCVDRCVSAIHWEGVGLEDI